MTKKSGKHLTISSNNVKYLGVTLNKQMKDLHDKNFKILTKLKISEDGKTSHAHDQ